MKHRRIQPEFINKQTDSPNNENVLGFTGIPSIQKICHISILFATK